VNDAPFYKLYTYARIEIDRACALITNGDSDAARRIIYSLESSGIIAVLSSHTWTIEEPNWSHLQWRMGQIYLMCHPEEKIKKLQANGRNGDAVSASAVDYSAEVPNFAGNKL
jgi:hypothetical protein